MIADNKCFLSSPPHHPRITNRTAEQIKAQANQEYKAGNYAAAVDLYSQSIKLEPSNATYYGNRSAALMMIKKYNDASKDCQTAVRLDPGFVKVNIATDFCFGFRWSVNTDSSNLIGKINGHHGTKTKNHQSTKPRSIGIPPWSKVSTAARKCERVH